MEQDAESDARYIWVLPELWREDEPAKSSAKPFWVENDDIVASVAFEVDNLMAMMIRKIMKRKIV